MCGTIGPGKHFPTPIGTITDVTIAASTGNLVVSKGSGCFTATSVWERYLPIVDHHYHFSLFTYGGPVALYNEIFGVAVLRTAASLQLEQHLTEIDQLAGIYRNTMLDYVDIDDADVTGDIVIRLQVSDATGTASSEISLDGGATWRSPFATAPVFVGRTLGQFLLSADPTVAGVVPTTTTTTSSTTTTLPGPDPCDPTGCRRSLKPSAGRLTVHDREGDDRDSILWRYDAGPATSVGDFGDPSAPGLSLCFKQGPLTWTPYVTTAPECGTPPCWKRKSSVWQFRGIRSVYLPFRRIELKAGPDGRTKLLFTGTGPGASSPSLPWQLPIEVVLRREGGTCWVSTFEVPGVKTNTSEKLSARPTS